MSQTCRSNSKHLFSSLVAHNGTFRSRITQLCSRAHPGEGQCTSGNSRYKCPAAPFTSEPSQCPCTQGGFTSLCSLTGSYWEPQLLTHHISSFCSPPLWGGAKARLPQLLQVPLGHSCHMSSLLQSLPPSLASLGHFLCLSGAALSLPGRKHKLLIHPSCRKLSGWKALWVNSSLPSGSFRIFQAQVILGF